MYCEMPGILDIKDDTKAKKQLIEIVQARWQPMLESDRQMVRRLYYRTTARRFTELQARVIAMVHSRMVQARKGKPESQATAITAGEYKAKMGLLF